MRKISLLFLSFLFFNVSFSQSNSVIKTDSVKWLKEARFGMFIHFGVSSQLEGVWKGEPIQGYSEWIMRTKKIPKKTYFEEVVKKFNPEKFNAEDWVNTAQQTGMKYFIVTAKHHDGVAMYDSKVSDFSITASPFKRDLLGELKAASVKHGLKFGFYYSHAMDWAESNAPGNDWDWEAPGGDKNLFGGKEWHKKYAGFIPNLNLYFANKVFPQVKELVERYHPDILWFDTPSRVPQEMNALLLRYVKLLDPNIIVNSRIAMYPLEGTDYTDTQDRPYEFYPVKELWEAVPTTNDSYGYSKYDNSHKLPAFFIRLIVKASARGGNVLLNMGPKSDGTIDTKDVSIFKGIGAWFKVNGESIYGTERTPLTVQSWGETTVKGNRLYLHVFNWPKDGKIVLGGLGNSVAKAYLLSDVAKKGLTVKKVNNTDYLIEGGAKAIDAVNTVVVVETTEGAIKAFDNRRLLQAGVENELRIFDCSEKSDNIEFGDGMETRIYAKNITATNQFIRFNTRLNTPANYKVVVEYQNSGKLSSQDFIIEAPTQNNEHKQVAKANDNQIEVQVGAQKLSAALQQTNDSTYAKTTLGSVQLPVGNIDIVIRPLKIATAEFARPKSVYLVPEK